MHWAPVEYPVYKKDEVKMLEGKLRFGACGHDRHKLCACGHERSSLGTVVP